MAAWNLAGYMDAKADALASLRERLQAPDAAPTPLSVVVRVAGGSGARPVKVREFTIVTDALPALAGNNLGPTAPEILLSALASCLIHSYVVVATDLGLRYDSIELEVRGQIDYRGTLRVDPAAAVPPTGIAYEARIASSASVEQLEAVRREVERFCPVFQALLQPTPVTGRVVPVASA
ncbi:MAG: OsmC family protein [Chloroflexi bacterium]|nr:OsmC family protein [Chloroflexota bacterium]